MAAQGPCRDRPRRRRPLDVARPAPLVPGIAERLGIPCRLTGSDGVALTFDDGPHPQGTPAVLEALAARRRDGDLLPRRRAGRTLARGRRPRSPRPATRSASTATFIASCYGGESQPWRATSTARTTSSPPPPGASRRLYRPPYGVFSSGALRLVRQRGWQPLLWSPGDATGAPARRPRRSRARAVRGLRGGDVVLLHDAEHYSAPDSWRRTVAALPAIVEAVAALGLPFVPASQSR